MSTSKFIGIALTTFVCATALVVDAGAQGRGGGGGGRGGSGGGSAGRSPSGGSHGGSTGQGARGGPTHAGPSHAGPSHGGAPGNGHGYYQNRSYGHYPYYGSSYYRGYYPYYGYRGYPYYGYGYPGFSFSIGFGYPYYGYYGYPYYGYAYPYAPAYPAYGYGGAYVVPGGAAYGGIKVQGAPRNAEVWVDGKYAGVVDDFDGAFQRLDLEPGSHEVEIRVGGGRPMVYDVNVTAGQTVTIHANTH